MRIELWYVFIGGLFVLVTMPVTLTMLYLAAGLALGPVGFGIAGVAVIEQAALLERVSELVVIISLFTAGLKLRRPSTAENASWRQDWSSWTKGRYGGGLAPQGLRSLK
jgi:predicted Kef-type K+ transport protein